MWPGVCLLVSLAKFGEDDELAEEETLLRGLDSEVVHSCIHFELAVVGLEGESRWMRFLQWELAHSCMHFEMGFVGL